MYIYIFFYILVIISQFGSTFGDEIGYEGYSNKEITETRYNFCLIRKEKEVKEKSAL